VSGPRRAEERLRRLLVMLPWLMEEGEVPLADVASRFGLTEAQVTKELELVAMCGLPPYVDEMIDVFVDDGIVFVGVPRLFTRSLRLTAPEGFSLLAAGRAAMELPGADPDGPLARGLAKLASALGAAGVGRDDTAGVMVDLDRPRLTDQLTAAVVEGAEMSLRYYSPARDELTDRVIVPRHVFTDGEHWYLLADDDRSGERRTFRVDRIEVAVRTGVLHTVDPTVAAPDGFFDDADIPRARLLLSPEGGWVTDRYPVDRVEPVEEPSGWVEVTLPVASERWLDRLLVRLGPRGRLVEPRSSAASELADRMLARYRS
jgi:proteasome accessory factor C